jgi:probable addiction module antidote protein
MVILKRSDEFDRWLRGLKDARGKAKVLVRLDRLGLGNPGDIAPVGEGVRSREFNMAQAQPFDVADYLESPEDVAHYLSEAFETGDQEYIARALGIITRSRGMAEVAREAGLNRGHLYKALSAGGNPALGTLLKVLDALHMRLEAHPIALAELQGGDRRAI